MGTGQTLCRLHTLEILRIYILAANNGYPLWGSNRFRTSKIARHYLFRHNLLDIGKTSRWPQPLLLDAQSIAVSSRHKAHPNISGRSERLVLWGRLGCRGDGKHLVADLKSLHLLGRDLGQCGNGRINPQRLQEHGLTTLQYWVISTYIIVYYNNLTNFI